MAVDVTVTNNTDRHRYEAHAGATVAGFVEYQTTDELIVLTHTEVDESFEGQGVGSRLARASLDDARERHLKALVTCPFIKGWIAHHPEYLEVLYDAPQSKATD